MSRSLIRRFTPFFAARIRQNHSLLTASFSSSSAVNEAASSSQSPSPSLDEVHLSDNCIKRMKELQATENGKSVLRLGVETGGCSGFQYVFDLDDKINPDDRIFEREGIKLVIDDISYDFVKGATIDYVEELIRSAFVVRHSCSVFLGRHLAI
ncbi:hypothetical protein JRO89_XS12G0106000 [Xanthoceras sorbifolium]|uniref:Core domain-containing protein n=1 Tax=Xanthoceras sorbifolium TaxID=99658 RepID=A0ABQ8HC46_9ROSI|nr:hypothetical protein JRO89_XS12G0106000 [Xanthoceras sorbifolium]